MKYFQELLKNYIGPALVAAVCIYGYWSYQTIQAQQVAIDQMSQILSGQCEVMLKQQGYEVTKGVNDGQEDEQVEGVQ